MKVLNALFIVSQASAASLLVPLWPQVGPPPPGTANAGEQRPLVLAPGLTIPAGRPGIVPLPRPQSAPPQTGATPNPAPAPVSPAPPSRPGSIVTSGASPSVALDPAPGRAAGAARPVPSGGCTATLNVSRVPVRSGGDVVEVRTQPEPAGCTPAVAVPAEWAKWITSGDPSVVRLSVTANPSRESRITAVHVADKVFLLDQAGVEAPGVAVVPGKIAFGLEHKKNPPKRRISIQSDDPNAAVTVMATAPWLTATPVKGKGREYDVQVDRSALPPGRLKEAAIRVAAGSAVVDVPVVVERQETR